MALAKILLCMDTDPQPSVFDSVVALDAGAGQLLRHGGVTPADVKNLIHGLMFTRGGDQLHHAAAIIGGSDVVAGEQLLQAAKQAFFGPVRVSVMLDSNGANTTAAAAVVCASRHLPLGPETIALVLGATGSVGQRVVRMLAREGADVRVASRRLTHAEAVCHRITAAVPGARVTPRSTTDTDKGDLLDAAHLVIATGAAGVNLLDSADLKNAKTLQVALDLNAVPPAGITGIAPTDKAVNKEGRICYGALAVGGLKMKIHKAAIRQLFESNDRILDADEIYNLGKLLADAK
ncbi:methylene-tetrahydromethanopterin dehydrogenase N-terminal domain-containing protein [Bythopirellula polymerisocia]|uniref:Bifunctional protein MdtA n=1 Tax=Bythopirellula polymerisocia TaxID=2528003 RepID=A0A5C6D4E0_9BACT|nr:methylene-tetrahydromethanopterin dehydrogenase N-terminal domain-containing protein [Bythopirellula polymerisocia]TWU29719.1 Bifunctional protein MdtA [Bythopirellula polymerisocia]